MRIVGGKNKRRTIVPPANFKARPTTDFAKENLFNVLSNYFDFEQLAVLDLFSGTGSISYEFASRGALRVVAVELNPTHHKFIENTARELKYPQMQVVHSNVFVYLRSMSSTTPAPGTQFDIVFADPPYDMDEVLTIPDTVINGNFLNTDGWLIIEHSSARDFSTHPHYWQTRKYGSVNFSIFLASV